MFKPLLIAGYIAATLTGCNPRKEDNRELLIQGVLAPPSSQESCQYQGNLDQAKLIRMGTMDLALTMTYTPYVLIQNTLKEEDGIPESADVVIEGVRVSVQDENGKELDTFIAPLIAQNPVLNGGGEYAAPSINLINAKSLTTFLKDTTAAKSKIMIVLFSVYGRTSTGTSIETKPFQFKVRACIACLVSYPIDSIDRNLEQSEGKPNCANRSTVPPLPCLIGQDAWIDCRSCPDRLACDPRVSHTLSFSTSVQLLSVPPVSSPSP
ncbi:hypothetical protein [Pajaroellobacter abortibovis]|nr:hypothetical protein [Pajaroellobacter abortibovis]